MGLLNNTVLKTLFGIEIIIRQHSGKRRILEQINRNLDVYSISKGK